MVKDVNLASGKKLDRGKRHLGIEEVDAFEPDTQHAVDMLKRMAAHTCKNQLLIVARFHVHEWRAQLITLRAVVPMLNERLLQDMLPSAGRTLRVRESAFQPLNAQRQQQPIFVGQ